MPISLAKAGTGLLTGASQGLGFGLGYGFGIRVGYQDLYPNAKSIGQQAIDNVARQLGLQQDSQVGLNQALSSAQEQNAERMQSAPRPYEGNGLSDPTARAEAGEVQMDLNRLSRNDFIAKYAPEFGRSYSRNLYDGNR